MNWIELLKENPFTTFLGVVVTALLGWFGVRTQKAPDIQASLNQGVAEVIKHYTTALEAARNEIMALRAEVVELRRTVETQNDRLERQSDEIDSLNQHVEALTVELVRAGIDPPMRRKTSSAKPLVAHPDVA